MSQLLKIYHRLPPGARSVVAGLRGAYLNWWRYSAATERIVAESLERDFWSREEWAAWQRKQLEPILERAVTRVPYYREYWREQRGATAGEDWRDLRNWPILEKSVLRERSRDFVADDCSPARMFHDHTSGTTGASLDLWLRRDSVLRWYAIFEARCRRWYGLSRKDRWAIIGGQLVVPVAQQTPPFWVWNFGLRQLYLSAYHLSPATVSHYLGAMKEHRVRYLLGYPSALYSLASAALEQGLRLPLDAVIANAEPVLEYQRPVIEAAFGGSLRETYGMAETVSAGSECEFGTLHSWPDVGVTEIVEPDNDGVGDLICTGLMNPDMPLIRYRVGDRASLVETNCQCGRRLPAFGRIDGRSDDVVVTPDGREVGRLDPVFKSGTAIREAQIIQEEIGLLRVKVVAGEAFDAAAERELTARLQDRVGEMQIIIERVAEIERTANGKFRAVISKVPKNRKP